MTTNGSTYVASALAEAHASYKQQNTQSAKLRATASAYLPGGNTRTILHSAPFPLTIASGKGATLTSVDDKTYVDFLGEYSAGIFGHSNKKINDAVTAALAKGWNYGAETVYEKELAKKVCDRFRPSGLELVRFTNSGTESNTMAIASALVVTGKKKILVFSKSYHGGTLSFPMSLIKGKTGADTINLPHDFVVAPYNNIPETKEIIAKLPANDGLAAILVEPIQGAAGSRPATLSFLRYLREVADSQKAIMIMDEVMASRLGPNGTSAELGIKPDMITLGKWIGGGMTFGAFGGRRDIMNIFNPDTGRIAHPGTYNNNVVTMSAGVAGIDIYNADQVHALNKLGESLKSAVQRILTDAGLTPATSSGAPLDVIEVDSFKAEDTVLYAGDNVAPSASSKSLPRMFISGKGSMLNVRFSGPDEEIWQALFYHHMLQSGIYIATRGYTTLHIEITQSHVDKYVEAVRGFVAKHGQALKK